MAIKREVEMNIDYAIECALLHVQEIQRYIEEYNAHFKDGLDIHPARDFDTIQSTVLKLRGLKYRIQKRREKALNESTALS